MPLLELRVGKITEWVRPMESYKVNACITPSYLFYKPRPFRRPHCHVDPAFYIGLTEYPPSGWVEFAHYLLKEVYSVYCKKIK